MPGGRTCRVSALARAVDFAQRNGYVSGWTVGRSERRGTEVPDRCSLNITYILGLERQASGGSNGAADRTVGHIYLCCW